MKLIINKNPNWVLVVLFVCMFILSIINFIKAIINL